MTAKGTVEEPGKNVAQKAGLNKAILDQCWGELFRQLAYKCGWYGSLFLAVRPAYFSQECPECKHVAKENRDSQAVFRCVACGYERHADTNAACIVLERGFEEQALIESAQVAEVEAELGSPGKGSRPSSSKGSKGSKGSYGRRNAGSHGLRRGSPESL